MSIKHRSCLCLWFSDIKWALKNLSQVNKNSSQFSFIAHTFVYSSFSVFRLTQCDRKFSSLISIFCSFNTRLKMHKIKWRRRKARERSNGVFNGIKKFSIFNYWSISGVWVFVAFDRFTTRLIFSIYTKFLGIDAVYGFGIERWKFLMS